MILGGDISSALTTFAGLGLALILERGGGRRVRLGWTDEVEPRMVVSAEGCDDDAISEAVHRHAAVCTQEGSWLQIDLDASPWDGKSAAFSPRIKAAGSSDGWRALQECRHTGVDREMEVPGVGLELIGALGEPAYWRFADRQGKESRPDEGASRWEMKTRNQGQDFVANRLRPLAGLVAAREVEQVRAGLRGESVIDEGYQQKRSEESRTASGLTAPRFTDSALAWCALWGISSFPVIHRLNAPSVTAGAVPIGRFTPDLLVLPVLVGPHSLERWRAILVAENLIRAHCGRRGERVVARSWLTCHGVQALAVFHVHVSDNANAPERSLGAGVVEVLK